MSETSIISDAAPLAESGIDMVPPGTGVEESEGGGDRRRLMIIGAVVGLLVVVAAAYLLLHKGSPASSDSSFVPHSTHAAPPASSGKAPATGTKAPATGSATGKVATTPVKLPRKAKAPQARDPFKPLILAPVAAGAGGATTTTTVTAPTAAPTGSTQTTPTGTVPAPAPSQTTTGHGTTQGTPLWIQLMSVKGDQATFKVGYAQHKFRRFIVQAPKAASSTGTVFDNVFALIGIQNGQVTIQIGDDTPFDLSRGISHAV